MPTLRYLHLDVFTDRLFGGNQLAVYLDPPHDLPAETMQAIAKEMAFAETTFVFPAAASAAPGAAAGPVVRIFTPASELPMAGHPTIGTAYALALAGRVAPGTPRIVLAEGVGPVPVDLEWQGDRLAFAWMTQPRPAFGPVIEAVTGFSEATHVAVGDMRPHGWPLQQVSCGVPFVIVPVSSRTVLDRAAPDASAHARAFAAAGMPEGHVYLFTMEPGPDGADVYTRMFAPDIGITEDAATGSAAGPLGAYLVHHGIVEPGRTLRNLQGVQMRRPSWIHVAPVLAAGATHAAGNIEIEAMRVGGQAVLVGEGTLDLPE
jgi:trans-2,3-dihydro-3-hydroxyanthranilate isomerase